MSEKPTNTKVEEFILASLPETFGGLHRRSPWFLRHSNADRWIDGALQRLRRRGLIAFERSGGKTTWHSKAPQS